MLAGSFDSDGDANTAEAEASTPDAVDEPPGERDPAVEASLERPELGALELALPEQNGNSQPSDETAPTQAGALRPPEFHHDFAHPQPELLRELIARWLDDEPHVLASPQPRVVADDRAVHARFCLAPDGAPREASRIQLELAALARDTTEAGGPVTDNA